MAGVNRLAPGPATPPVFGPPDPAEGELARHLNETLYRHLPSTLLHAAIPEAILAPIAATNCFRRMIADAPGDLIFDGELASAVRDILETTGAGRAKFWQADLLGYVQAGWITPYAWVLRSGETVGWPGGHFAQYSADGQLESWAMENTDPLSRYRSRGLVLPGDVTPSASATPLFRYAQVWEVLRVRRWAKYASIGVLMAAASRVRDSVEQRRAAGRSQKRNPETWTRVCETLKQHPTWTVRQIWEEFPRERDVAHESEALVYRIGPGCQRGDDQQIAGAELRKQKLAERDDATGKDRRALTHRSFARYVTAAKKKLAHPAH
ncbi:MAG: helix-turn-helix domain-containing protein [Dehalococcoidia bacterium]